MRRDMTKHERILWSELRARRFDGFHFRRQQPIGPYIADFYCAAAKLIIELDGGHHSEVQQRKYDSARTRWLEAKGLRVLRFSNFAGTRELNSILEAIWQAVHLPPSP